MHPLSRFLAPLAVVSTLALASCAAPSNTASSSSAAPTESVACDVDSEALVTPGTFTVHADQPLYAPWYIDNDPTSGEGYESAMVYALADKLGFSPDDVAWGYTAFNSSYAPGDKDFDIYVTEVAITDQRAQAVTFSNPYYDSPLVLVTREDSNALSAASLEELRSLTFGTLVGSSYYDYIVNTIKPTTAPQVFDTNTDATQALLNGTVDATIQSLQIGLVQTTVQYEGLTLAGYLPNGYLHFGMVLQKDNPYVSCINDALSELEADGTLADLRSTWLTEPADLKTFSE